MHDAVTLAATYVGFNTLVLDVASATTHDRVAIEGEVDLDVASLELNVTYTPDPSDVLTLIDNDGADAVVDVLAGLDEGAAVGPFRISYVGGDGNDVVVSIAPPANTPPVAVDDNVSTNEETAVDINVLANDTDPDGDTLSLAGVGLTPDGATSVEGRPRQRRRRHHRRRRARR